MEGGGQANKSANFNLEPLSTVSESFKGAKERVVLLAIREGFATPYKFELWIPEPAEADRQRGLDLLWARVVTIMASVVGTSRLAVFCSHDETFNHIRSSLDGNPKLLSILKAYGPVQMERTDDESKLAVEPLSLPFVGHGGAGDAGKLSVPSEEQVFVGIDYGRSDVKVAALDKAGEVVSTYVTRWWRSEDGERKYVDPQKLQSHEEHLRCMAEAGLDVLRQKPELANRTICGLGVSAAGCVCGGKIIGVPPTFGGVDAQAAAPAIADLAGAILQRMKESWKVDPACAMLLVNDGDASALYGASSLADSPGKVGLFLSCGTGLAGGIVCDNQCCAGVLEVGKLVVGLPGTETSGVVPKHDGMDVEGVAQGVAGTQRSFFNLLAARGGALIEDKAEQRATLVAMQKRKLDEEVQEIFQCLGFWLAQFVLELQVYLPFKIHYVEAGGKLTDSESGAVLLQRAAEILRPHGVSDVKRAADSEFGQAIAMAKSVWSPQ